MSATPWSTTPSDVPSPRRTSWVWCCSTLASEAPWQVHSPNQIRMPMHTMLLTIGAQATAMKRRRVLSSAAPSAKRP